MPATNWITIMVSGDELIPRLGELYSRMDSAYEEAMRQAGFSCVGCDGVKCCTVDLLLHTTIEVLHLRRGLRALDDSRRRLIIERAREIVRAKDIDPTGDPYRNSVCPVNSEGLCELYEYRPMICRLAGIPHYIARPDGRTVRSGGCPRYGESVEQANVLEIDRTPFYRDMAVIEIEIIKSQGTRMPSRTISEALAAESASV